jgi:hypothetical protein
MAERRKGKQINFRLTDELGESFESYCQQRGITMTQFLENSIRQALGQPLTIPPDALGISHRIANVEATSTPDVDSKIDEAIAPIRAELEEIKLRLGSELGELTAVLKQRAA